jgi:hypothetical protein
LLGHFVPFAPDHRAAPAAAAVPKPNARLRGRLYTRYRCRAAPETRPFANYLSIRDRYSVLAKFILRILSGTDAKSIEPTADVRLFC